ncbi:MAG: hypothetical protein M3N56_05555 [Actinomycetota bacterium]|nr:hypothetical protein [Actinomycetota bacterium]
MAGIDPQRDPRGARWEARLRKPVMGAALLALPTVFLYFSKLEGWVAILAVTLAWSIWVVFVAEAAIMLTVVQDRWAWVRGHLFGLAIIVATFPALTQILEGLLAARALSTLQGTRVLQVLYLAKAGKLIKSALILRKDGTLIRHPVLSSAVILVLAIVLVGIGHRVVSGEKHATPVHNAVDLVDGG